MEGDSQGGHASQGRADLHLKSFISQNGYGIQLIWPRVGYRASRRLLPFHLAVTTYIRVMYSTTGSTISDAENVFSNLQGTTLKSAIEFADSQQA